MPRCMGRAPTTPPANPPDPPVGDEGWQAADDGSVVLRSDPQLLHPPQAGITSVPTVANCGARRSRGAGRGWVAVVVRGVRCWAQGGMVWLERRQWRSRRHAAASRWPSRRTRRHTDAAGGAAADKGEERALAGVRSPLAPAAAPHRPRGLSWDTCRGVDPVGPASCMPFMHMARRSLRLGSFHSTVRTSARLNPMPSNHRTHSCRASSTALGLSK